MPPAVPFQPSEAWIASITTVTIEEVTLCAIGILATVIRVCGRARAAGFKGLRADDYLASVGALFYAILTTLSVCIGYMAWALTNSSMADEQRAALAPDDAEFQLRVMGSKFQIGRWVSYMACLWALKASLLFLYLQLTEGLGRHYAVRIYVGFGLLITSWIAVLVNLLLACRPFYKYWQIQPDPGNICQPTVSSQIIWVNMSLNIFTDLYLISIPVPLLWRSSFKPIKKIGLIVLFSGGLLVAVCAVLRSVLVFTDPIDGSRLACLWASREVFVAVVTTNLPIVFPRFARWFTQVFGLMLSLGSQKQSDRTPTGFRSFGGGGKYGPRWLRRGPPSPNPITDLTLTASQVEMIDSSDLQLLDAADRRQRGAEDQSIKTSLTTTSLTPL
ncbi:hypothetical protein X797_008473 [Metarhizium robertsii]|uniref:Polyketide synthase n=2 Tax=Metarhizium robertsii TaxID=568076 RepID=E9F7X1_METRA|nr:polyketide synthase [Metarhizium robertsii ARSEF 23]EFY96259.2 polyketide synthase [Metarhizium robertsii ARSEF 23]EXU98525.1 hypothetical protein X797_008473 [Metarhizium robertsii]